MHTKSCHCGNIRVSGQQITTFDASLHPLLGQHLRRYKGDILRIDEASIKILFPQYVTVAKSSKSGFTLTCNVCCCIVDVIAGSSAFAVVREAKEKSDYGLCRATGLQMFFPFQLRRYVEFAPADQSSRSGLKTPPAPVSGAGKGGQREPEASMSYDEDLEYQSLFGESNICFVGSFRDFENAAHSHCVLLADQNY